MKVSQYYQIFRSKLLPSIDKYADKIDMYTAYQLPEEERIGIISNASVEEAVELLEESGYEYNPLSAAKEHPEIDMTDNGSFRRVPENYPEDLPEDSSIKSDWLPKHTQYHIHIFNVEEGVEVFSHYEVRPDIIKPDMSVERLKTHYRPDWNDTYIVGMTERPILDLLDESG